MRRTSRWCGIGVVGGLLACGESQEPYTTYDPSAPTTVQPSTPTTDPPVTSTTDPPNTSTTDPPGTSTTAQPTTGRPCSYTDQPCAEDVDCCDDICLPGGLCGRFADGEPCTQSHECASGFCSSMGVCGCLGAGVCCEDAPGDCCGSCNEKNTCVPESCGGSGSYCGVFGGGSCCPGFYCDVSFFGSYCKESSDPPPEPPDPCKDPDTDTDSDTDTTAGPPPDLPPPDPVCGDGVINGAEVCDGQELGGKQCTDFPGFGGGSLACTADCTHDTGDCCKSMNQPCATDGECCAGTACKFDLLMGKNVCK